MPAKLLDYQFELSDVVFGYNSPIILDGEDGFDPGIASLDVQDTEFEQEDGRHFGIDYLRGPTWSWQLGTNMADPTGALSQLGRLAKAWRADGVRLTPGEYLPLRYAVGGRTRRVYGRPRRFSYPPENRLLGGWLPITCDFVTADALHYDDALASSTMSLQPSTSGGFISPFTFPLSTLRPTLSKANTITVGGNAFTWAMVTINGPVTDPRFECLSGGWEIGFELTLTADQSITIDSRPWARTAIRNDGASVGGQMTRKSRLSNMKLAPGGHSFAYRGTDEGGSSRATVAWRNAHHSL